MESLPPIDAHEVRVAATPELTWDAVLALTRGRLARAAPSAFIALWGLRPDSGFEVVEETPPRRLALRGRHRFSRYELAFDVEPRPDGAALTARTSAVFPGIAGRAYRALVIGSGGHRILVNRMLAQIARRAGRAA